VAAKAAQVKGNIQQYSSMAPGAGNVTATGLIGLHHWFDPLMVTKFGFSRTLILFSKEQLRSIRDFILGFLPGPC
jgi:hypothetical protein